MSFLVKPGKNNDRTEKTEACIVAKQRRPTSLSKATKLGIVVAADVYMCLRVYLGLIFQWRLTVVYRIRVFQVSAVAQLPHRLPSSKVSVNG